MEIIRQQTPELDRLAKMIDKTHVGMLVTFDSDRKFLHGRPLTTLKMDDEPALWFLTSISSPKILELDDVSDVCITYTAGESYVSVSGKSEINRDRAAIKTLWTPYAKIWFPEGPDDPDIAILKIAIQHAEYWDSPGGRLTQLFALATGNERLLGENVKVDV